MHDDPDGIPARSEEGRAALDIFYFEFNDINFYVEDDEQENLYELIFRKLFPEMRICRIFPLKGKANVLKHATDSSDSSNTLRCVYVVDKDFDDLLGRAVSDSRIFYLDRYCIENYLIDEDAMVGVVVETHPKKKKEDIQTVLGLRVILPVTIQSLRPLFELFYCVQFFDLGLPNCGTKPEEFCKAKCLWELNADRLAGYVDLIIAESALKGISPPLEDPFYDTRSEPARLADHHSIISGKFLLAMLFHYVKGKFSLGSITFDSFVYRVAKNSNLSSLESFAERIRTSIRIQVTA